MKNKRNIKKAFFKIVSTITVILSSMSNNSVLAIDDMSAQVLNMKNISKGVKYEEKQLIYSMWGKQDTKQRVNAITADLNSSDVDVIFSKANEKALGKMTLTEQINNMTQKGELVSVGINGDFFNTQNGASVGPQVHNGEFISAYACKEDENRYPILFKHGDNKIDIDTLHFQGKLTVTEESGKSYSIDIDSINRYDQFEAIKYKVSDKLMVLTPNYNNTGIINASSYAPSDLLTVITDLIDEDAELIKEGLKLGKEYKGTVDGVGEGIGQAKIPNAGVVLASNGSKAQWIKEHIKKGDKIKITADFNIPDIKEAISSYTYLVKDGKALNYDELLNTGTEEYLIKGRRQRTALGLTKDNKIIAVALDGGYAAKGVSDGASLPEMAEIMKSMGAVTAINFDGGGSTQMNLRKYALKESEPVNILSNGAQRRISNAVLFLNNSSKSDILGSFKFEKDTIIYINSSCKFNLVGEDINYNPCKVDSNKIINWTSNGNKDIGTISSEGIFTSGKKAGVSTVSAEIDGIKQSSNVTVVDKVDVLTLKDPDVLNLDRGYTYVFTPAAHNLDGQEIVLDKGAVKWTVTGGIGTISDRGVLKVTAEEGIGEVIGEAGGKTAVVKIEVGKSTSNTENEK